MKKYLSFAAFVLILIVGLTTASCEKGDGDIEAHITTELDDAPSYLTRPDSDPSDTGS